MLKSLRALLIPKPSVEVDTTPTLGVPPSIVGAPGVEHFDVVAALQPSAGIPVLDWTAAQQWVERVQGAADQAKAWAACERAWLEHARGALGAPYHLQEKGSAVVLSTLSHNVAEATLAFLNKTLQRVERILDGVARVSEWGQDILIVFDDDEAYYKYVSHYYPEAGEFAASSGMYINAGCGHFVTVKDDLRSIEPVIAHELTHSCLSHLPIPAWLNEGIAVNTEHRLCPWAASLSMAQEMHARHRRFWGPEEIQEFWSGKSFLRADDGNELSYDLARIIVAQFAADWQVFRPFVLSANLDDGGASAAVRHLGVNLGDAVLALLERAPSPGWAPDPMAWSGAPEHGSF